MRSPLHELPHEAGTLNSHANDHQLPTRLWFFTEPAHNASSGFRVGFSLEAMGAFLAKMQRAGPMWSHSK